MRQNDRKLLRSLFGVQSASRNQQGMLDFMHVHLLEYGMDVVEAGGQLYARKGDPNVHVPYFVAHADTVHRIVPDENYRVSSYMTNDGDITHRAIDPTTGAPRGIGGDDKCGLFACLIAAQELENVGVFIAIDEELGCLGSRRAHEELFVRPGCFIQLDRRGNRDAVDDIYGPLGSVEWVAAMSPLLTDYGFTWVSGAITDVGELCPATYLSGVNLSAGYHLPHSANEWVSETDLETSIELAIAIARRAGNDEWVIPHERLHPPRTQHYKRYNATTNAYEDWDFGDPDRWESSQEKGKVRTPATLLAEESAGKGTLWAYGIPTTWEDGRGETYDHYVQIGYQTERVSVVVDNPMDWEFDDALLVDSITADQEKDVNEQVMRHWNVEIEPLLAVIYGEDDYPLVYTDSEVEMPQGGKTLTEILAELYEHKDPLDLCDAWGCFDPWATYDVLSKRWYCTLHAEAQGEDTAEIREKVRLVAEAAGKVKMEPTIRRKIVRQHAESIVDGPAPEPKLRASKKKGTIVPTPEATIVA